jgi:hypothetical protein
VVSDVKAESALENEAATIPRIKRAEVRWLRDEGRRKSEDVFST